jgi:Xaa-Pro aminopeptidase
MLTEAGCQARRRRLWESVPPEIEWLLIADPRHVRYLANFGVQPMSFSNGERGLLLLERENGATLLADNFTVRSASGTAWVDREVVETWYDHKHSVINRDHALLKAVKSLEQRLFGRAGAVEAEWLPLGAWEVLGLDHESHSVTREAKGPLKSPGAVDLGTLLRRLRRRKEPDEIELLRFSARVMEAGHARAREVIRPGISEVDVFAEIQAACQRAAGRGVLIYGDFRANSPQAPKAGGLPTKHVLEDGELFILDYSAMVDGYRCDFTNTQAVGRPSSGQEMLFRLCQAAMEAGEKALRAGAPAKDVYAAASEPMKSAGYGPIPHHAGHGIGLAHPEAPILVPDSEDVLVAGDVVTLEPGLYIEGTGGIRIEHNYLITDAGYERISQHLISLT